MEFSRYFTGEELGTEKVWSHGVRHSAAPQVIFVQTSETSEDVTDVSEDVREIRDVRDEEK